MKKEIPQSLPGLDLKDGMNRFSNNWETYTRIMIFFLASHESVEDELQKLVAAEDYEATAELAHKLKGGAANLSATDLRDATLSLEKAALRRDFASIEKHLANVSTCLDSLRDVVNSLR